MSRYTTFHLWCPQWAPRAETNHPTLQEAILREEWRVRTPWCQFRTPDTRPVRSFYEFSTPENVRRVVENYRCTTHGTPPEVIRQTAAIERRHRAATHTHYDVRRFGPHNAPEALQLAPYYSRYTTYILYVPRNLGREKTLHYEWEND